MSHQPLGCVTFSRGLDSVPPTLRLCDTQPHPNPQTLNPDSVPTGPVPSALLTAPGCVTEAPSQLACSDIQIMGSAVVELSVEELKAMSAAELSDCVATLGQDWGWSHSQLTTLLDRVKQVNIPLATLSLQLIHIKQSTEYL